MTESELEVWTVVALRAVPVLEPLIGVVWSTFSSVTAAYCKALLGALPDQLAFIVLPEAAEMPESSR